MVKKTAKKAAAKKTAAKKTAVKKPVSKKVKNTKYVYSFGAGKAEGNGKMKELMDGAMGDSNSEVNEAMNEAMNDFNADNMINESLGGMNLEEYGLGTNDLMSELPSGITIG